MMVNKDDNETRLFFEFSTTEFEILGAATHVGTYLVIDKTYFIFIVEGPNVYPLFPDSN